MTKNILAIAVAAALTVPFAAANAGSHGGSSAPEISFNGSARYRIADQKLEDANPAVATTNVSTGADSRVRFGMKAKLAGGVTVVTSIENDEAAGSTNVNDAYIMAPLTKSLSVKAGDFKTGTWGMGMVVNGDMKQDRISLIYKMSKKTTIGFHNDPKASNVVANTYAGMNATGTAAATGTSAKDGYMTAITATHTLAPKNGMMPASNVGLLYRDLDSMLDIFVNYTIAASHTMIKFENLSRDGGITVTGNTKAETQGSTGLMVIQPFSETIMGIVAYVNTTNGRVANSDFAPVSVVGTGTNKTAFMNWGNPGGDTTGLMFGGMFKDVAGTGADVTVMMGSATGETFDGFGTATVLSTKSEAFKMSLTDVVVTKKIAKSVTGKFSYGTIVQTPTGGKDVTYTAMGMSLSTKF